MSKRNKRGLRDFDPNASDPEDLDWDVAEREKRASPQKKRNRASSARQRPQKRQRRGYRGSDVEDDDGDLETDDAFTSQSSEEDIEINPTTGRSVRRAAKKPIKYEEFSEDDIQDTPSEDDEVRPQRRKAKERKSLIIVLKVPGMKKPTAARNLRARTGSKQPIARGKTKTPEVAAGIRRSSRLSHDIDEPMVALTSSGKHVDIVRQGTRSPEPVIGRVTRGGKGLKQPAGKQPSIIPEASHETSTRADSQPREDSPPGPLDDLLREDTQVHATHEHSPAEQEAQLSREVHDADDEEAMEGVIQESQPEEAPDSSDSSDGPVTRAGRNLRSRGKSAAKRKRGADESSDFEPGPEDENQDEMSASEKGNKQRQSSEDTGSGRRSARIRAKGRKSRRGSESDDHDTELDPDELAEEAQELRPRKRARLSRRNPDADVVYDDVPALRNRANKPKPDYRILRPDMNNLFDDDEIAPASTARPRGGRSGYRSLFATQGPFGGGMEGPTGPGTTIGVDSDSSDDDVQKAIRPVGGTVGMTPTSASAPRFGFPQVHGADPQQATASGGGPANFGKVKDKKALADADPLGVDPTVTFDGVGGLDDHINKLKEMVMLPLLYPEVFQRFHVTPPRGVLFHGPPGTGKTLLARALASSVSSHGQKVTFYMRKGADALSKWVGEAERQLRLLFEEARKTQPSIIFFDEIDGLAPVRSSKQEQIHASIVATLLALMDGMDGRGQVIVIGATNRPDSVDPALRRPGRFDREFYFPLPNVVGRRAIIDIHTKNWDPPLQPTMKDQLAELTKGYGGADIRALCTEAALNAVQGTYPQIYQSERKLLIDPSTIKVLAKDFMVSVNKIVPSSQRTASSNAAPLSKQLEPLLRKPLEEIITRIDELIPRRKKLTALEEAQFDDREDERGFEKDAMLRDFERGRIFRPRLLITGLQGMGQSYLGAALLNKLEGLHVQSFDLPTILEDPSRTPEAAITQMFTEVRRHKPSVIYIPHVDVWYQTLPTTAIKSFKLLLRSIGANEPILLLGVMEQATAKEKPDPQMLMDLFSFSKNNQYTLEKPNKESRLEFFSSIANYIRTSPADFPDPDNRKKRILPELPPAPQVAPAIDPREEKERQRWQKKQDRLTLNRLKILIQPIMDQLKKQYRKFFKPPILDEMIPYLFQEADPDFFRTDLPPEQQQEQGVFRPFERAKDPKGVECLRHVESGRLYYNLDLGIIEKRLSNGYYKRPDDFVADIKTLAKDARQMNDPDRTIKANEMLSNVEVDIEGIRTSNPQLVAECDAVYTRDLERARKATEKAQKEAADAGKEVRPVSTNVPPQNSVTETTEASGPIMLGEPVPGQHTMPPVTPLRQFPVEPHLSNGTTSADTGSNAAPHNGSAAHPSGEDDTVMTDSQDLNQPTQQHEFQTPSRPGTQTQKSQISGRTFLPANSHPAEYHNSASTTTSGHKTSDRSSGGRFNTQNTQSTNGVATTGVPDFEGMMPQLGGSQLPDTQVEAQFVSSQPSNSQQSVSSQNPSSMAAPAAPRQNPKISSLLNDEPEPPRFILDEAQLRTMLEELTRGTSELSLEQLEQVNSCLMETIWRARHMWNRNQVIQLITDAYNVIIEDIASMQELLKPSQDVSTQDSAHDPRYTTQASGYSYGGSPPPTGGRSWAYPRQQGDTQWQTTG